jgi:hypothetical protein
VRRSASSCIDRAWEFSRMVLYRIDGDRIVEAWYVEDTLGWLQQLGALPPLADISRGEESA